MNSERRLAHRQGRRALKASLTLGVLLGLFFGAWLPFFITNMAEVSGGSGGQGWRHSLMVCSRTLPTARALAADPPHRQGRTRASQKCLPAVEETQQRGL